MKILVIHNNLWAHYKSALFQEISRNMPAHMVFHVLQIAKSEKARAKMNHANHPEYQYPYTLLFDDYNENIPKFKEIFVVLKFIWTFKPHVVNVTGYSTSPAILPAIFFSKLLGKKVVMSNESTKSEGGRSFLKENIKKLAVKMCSGFVVFGKTSKDYLLELGARQEQIFVQKAAVVDNIFIAKECSIAKKENCFPEIKTSFNFIYTGRIATEKNIDTLISAFQKVKYQVPDCGLIIVGNGPEDVKIQEHIQQASKDIYRYDAVGWTEVPKFLSKADCFVLPSNSEPWGLVINEALVCGLTAIVSEACGCAPDLINGNGYVVPVGNISALEDAMLNIAQSNNLQKMKNRSLQIIKDFSLETAAKQYVEGLSKL